MLLIYFVCRSWMYRQCCAHLGQVRLVGAAQGSGLHMLRYQTLVSENMQSQPLTRRAHVLVNHSVCLCKDSRTSSGPVYETSLWQRKLKLGRTKIWQVVLSSREGEWAAVFLHAWRRNSPHFCHMLEDLSGLQLVSPLVNPRTAGQFRLC